MLIESLSGIRGVFAVELDESIVKSYSSGFCKGKGKIVLGYDSRQSSSVVKQWIIDSCGCEIVDVGLLPTPAIGLAVKFFNADGGIIITASHNEPEFNGLKILSQSGSIITEKELLLLKSVSAEHKKGTIVDGKEKALSYYCNHLLSKIDLKAISSSNIKLLLDPNGGASIPVLSRIMRKLGIKYRIMNEEVGVFKRKIEPSIASLDYLSYHLDGFDFAAAFDCDSDRVELVLPKNSVFAKDHSPIVNGNYVFAMAADALLKTKLVMNIATSNLLREIAQRKGQEIVFVDVGEINVIEGMRSCASNLGGEGSNGGVIFEGGTSRDGILTLLVILDLLAREGKSLDMLLEGYPNYYSFPRKIISNSFDIEKIKLFFRDERIIERGYGIRIETKSGTIFMRPSKTEHGILRVITDAKTKEDASMLMNMAMEALESSHRTHA